MTPGRAVPGRALWVRIALFESRKVRAEKEKLKHPPAWPWGPYTGRRAIGPSSRLLELDAPSARFRAPSGASVGSPLTDAGPDGPAVDALRRLVHLGDLREVR